MKFIKYLSVLLILFSNQLFAQVIITDLQENVLIKKENQILLQKNRSVNDTLYLPFIDDFSGSKIFPNPPLWLDKSVFINSDYPINSYSNNVATFDALDSTGSIYRNANTSGFAADTLTSRPIKLDSIYDIIPHHQTQITDNIYFSFCYQPQGIGNAPEKSDSLVLQFYKKNQKIWCTVWLDSGTTYQNFYQSHQNSFCYKVIPLNDTAYFTDGFQFRFYNYASLSNTSLNGARSNCDQWHIDYVYLNNKRSPTDTTYNDLAVSRQGNSFLKNYYAMPWRQFKINPVNELNDSTKMTICNLDKELHSCYYFYKVFDDQGVIYSSDTTANYPYVNSYEFITPTMQVPSDVFPVNNEDNALYTVKSIIRDVPSSFVQSNDTVSFYQDFSNYYAYDDGNPESGIGLTPANSKLALKFTLNTPDTLRAVQIYFNTTPNNANQRYFKLMVWKSLDPEVVLYSKGGFRPVFGEDYNCYHYYRLDELLVLSDSFYVGVQQTTDDYLNIGFDLNNDSKNKAFYKTSVNWEQVPFSGAIMMRPVLGSVLPPNASISEMNNTFGNVNIYPNPAKDDILHIDLPDILNKNKIHLQLIDIYGRTLYSNKYCNMLNISAYSDGMYFIRITNLDTKETYTTKVLISK